MARRELWTGDVAEEILSGCRSEPAMHRYKGRIETGCRDRNCAEMTEMEERLEAMERRMTYLYSVVFEKRKNSED